MKEMEILSGQSRVTISVDLISAFLYFVAGFLQTNGNASQVTEVARLPPLPCTEYEYCQFLALTRIRPKNSCAS